MTITPPKDTDKAYTAGYDYGKNGADMENCHFTLFALPELTKAWEQGKKDAEEDKL